MDKHVVICIGRQFGSGGREVGMKLAQALGCAFYDKELLQNAAAKSGILQELFEQNDEKPVSALQSVLLPPEGMGLMPAMADYVGFQPNEQLQNVIADVIQDAADTGPCVIIGRCADYILRDRPGMLSVFVHAQTELRIQRVARLHNLEEDAARALIRKTDRSRSNYYGFYTDRDWGAADNYHLALDVGQLGIENAVLLLQRASALV